MLPTEPLGFSFVVRRPDLLGSLRVALTITLTSMQVVEGLYSDKGSFVKRNIYKVTVNLATH
jgi:hypothetical protein